MTTTRRTVVSREDFVVAWACARTLDDVVKSTGMRRASAQQRAGYLRRHGVKLPKLTSARGQSMTDPLHIAHLNSLIKKHDIRQKGGV